METGTWISVIAGFAGPGVFFVLVVWLGRSFVEKTLDAAVKKELAEVQEKLKHGYARALETAKSRLKREELLFNRKLDALGALNRLLLLTHPRATSPDPEYSEAMEDVCDGAGTTEKLLKEFLLEHGAFPSKTVANDLERIRWLCEEATFGEVKKIPRGTAIYKGLTAAVDAVRTEVESDAGLAESATE